MNKFSVIFKAIEALLAFFKSHTSISAVSEISAVFDFSKKIGSVVITLNSPVNAEVENIANFFLSLVKQYEHVVNVFIAGNIITINVIL